MGRFLSCLKLYARLFQGGAGRREVARDRKGGPPPDDARRDTRRFPEVEADPSARVLKSTTFGLRNGSF